MPDTKRSETDEVNEVRLVGRVAAEPQLRELPSGDIVCSVRVVVRRPPSAVRGTATVDALECATFDGRLRRSVSAWAPGDVVEVSGALRRRFFRAGGGVASWFEVELARGRLIRRAAT
jgi:single-strand DNA-binding protein